MKGMGRTPLLLTANSKYMFTLIAHAQEVHEAAATSGGIGALGLNVSSLLFQILNFAVLLLLLRLFAYKPVLNILQERRRKIEESLATADLLAKERAALSAQQKEIISQAESKASALVRQSQDQAKKLLAEANEEANRQKEQILTDTRAQAQVEIAALRGELQKEVVGLVVATTEKVLEEKLDSAADTMLIEKKLQQL